MPAGSSTTHQAGHDQLPFHLLAPRDCGSVPGASHPRHGAQQRRRARLPHGRLGAAGPLPDPGVGGRQLLRRGACADPRQRRRRAARHRRRWPVCRGAHRGGQRRRARASQRPRAVRAGARGVRPRPRHPARGACRPAGSGADRHAPVPLRVPGRGVARLGPGAAPGRGGVVPAAAGGPPGLRPGEGSPARGLVAPRPAAAVPPGGRRPRPRRPVRLGVPRHGVRRAAGVRAGGHGADAGHQRRDGGGADP